MGFSFRKSFKVGPVRLNLSKRGVGVSAGVKGLRVGVGPGGARLSAGRGPLRYTKQIGGRGRRRSRWGCLLVLAAVGAAVLLPPACGLRLEAADSAAEAPANADVALETGSGTADREGASDEGARL